VFVCVCARALFSTYWTLRPSACPSVTQSVDIDGALHVCVHACPSAHLTNSIKAVVKYTESNNSNQWPLFIYDQTSEAAALFMLAL